MPQPPPFFRPYFTTNFGGGLGGPRGGTKSPYFSPGTPKFVKKGGPGGSQGGIFWKKRPFFAKFGQISLNLAVFWGLRPKTGPQWLYRASQALSRPSVGPFGGPRPPPKQGVVLVNQGFWGMTNPAPQGWGDMRGARGTPYSPHTCEIYSFSSFAWVENDEKIDIF